MWALNKKQKQNIFVQLKKKVNVNISAIFFLKSLFRFTYSIIVCDVYIALIQPKKWPLV